MKKHEDNPDMRVLKTSSCKTISGKSNITYQLGCTPDLIIHLRITKNDGGGFHSDEWVPFNDILEALKDDSKGAAITSIRLTSLFRGKSVNTPSFLLAALKHLKLVRSMQGKQRHHERLNPGPFQEMVEKLMSSTPAAKPKSASKKTARKTVRKAPRKKATVKTRTKKKATSQSA